MSPRRGRLLMLPALLLGCASNEHLLDRMAAATRLDETVKVGPYAGIIHTDQHQAVIDRLPAFAPAVIERLDSTTSELEAIGLVYCLARSRTCEAVRAVQDLKEAMERGERFKVLHDVTLCVAIDRYLQAVGAKKAGGR